MKIRAFRIRTSAPWLARLALFALLFQVTAFDHQVRPEITDLHGVVGSSSHQMHCHGGTGGCANGGSDMPAAIHTPMTLPVEPALFLLNAVHDVSAPLSVPLEVSTQPPQA